MAARFTRTWEEEVVMRIPLLVWCLAALVALVPATGDAGDREEQAVKAAEAWLALVDAGDYGASWDDAAQMFKRAVSKEQWETMVQAVRPPLGQVESRTVKSAVFAATLPGAPDGEYVVIQLETSFANKKAAIETVTPMKDPDGEWRVSGYYVR
jgi:hypothetical protein